MAGRVRIEGCKEQTGRSALPMTRLPSTGHRHALSLIELIGAAATVR